MKIDGYRQKYVCATLIQFDDGTFEEKLLEQLDKL
jgi:hypothetical protein